MHRLTNLDTSFLRLEKPDAPMNVGGTMIFDAPADKPMTFERLKAHMQARLPTARVFRERLLKPALPLENPSWVADQPVDIDAHMTHVQVRGPIEPAALRDLANEFFSEVLPRDRPLWNMLYIDEAPVRRGVRQANPGRFAVLLKVHHAAVDGVSAEAVLSGLLDSTPTPRVIPPDAWEPQAPVARVPLAQSLRNAARSAGLRELADTAGTLGKRFIKRALDPQEKNIPYYFRAPHSSLNVPISENRVFPSAHLSLPAIKQIRRACEGSTVNDVVLAVCGGALRLYLQETDALPAASMVAMAPISRRAAENKHQQGNQVSSMLVALATEIDDPLVRLARITKGTRVAKAYNRDMTIEALFDALPEGSPALFLGAWTRLNLSRRTPPMFNVVVTNVPGSPVPMYLDGARMQSLTGMAGIYDGVGLTMVVTSYVDTLTIGITSTPEVLSSPQRFVACLHEALAELAAEAAVLQKAEPEPIPDSVR